ncbi:bifunctional nuclease family protein [Sphingobacterium rhinopitheci]|uniref:bifunctional nuclease family protein n=1 Tax=Sphingobacterium rhinopitheci TaxID=2781960 RepID=UPI001F521BC2|nr:bifunctional nuclease family protein [Sphingobacterium rhinopitheci]MCI0920721.1 bifunctional nuclease family protein [Sphingobacterium rhinopitheci]
MKKIQLDIVGLSYSQTQSGAYALVLGEINGNRRLPIIIGSFEAQAIAVEIEKMKPTRPLTHDLIKAFADSYAISIEEVLIYNLVDGIFFARITTKSGTETKELDARTSDAVALAVRFNCPIYTYEFIMSSAGIVIESSDFAFLENIASTPNVETIDEINEKYSQPKQSVSPYSSLTKEQLENTLQKAIDNEKYEIAARIRDEIERRK